MRQAGAQHFDEGAKALLSERPRRKGGKSPGLSAGVVDVWRRPWRKAGDDLGLPAPGMAAARVRPDSQIAYQADSHARTAGCMLGVRQATVGQPLEEGMEPNLLGIRRGKHRDIAAVRRPKAGWPLLPPLCSLGQMCGVQCFECRVLLQRIAGLLTKLAEGLLRFRRCIARKSQKQIAQKRQALMADLRPVDQIP